MFKLQDKKLFIFDWDGTLSTSTLIVAGSRIFRKSYNIKNIEKNFKYYEGIGKRTMSLELKEDTNKAFARIYDVYAKFHMPKAKKGSEELLKLLNKTSKKVTLFSDSRIFKKS